MFLWDSYSTISQVSMVLQMYRHLIWFITPLFTQISGHPNVKLFITHGGLLGTIEAVHEGVPMLGIPIFGDQHINMRAIESAGAGIVLDYKTLNQQTILQGIRTLLKPE